MSEDRSLAAQVAAWVPPWERADRTPGDTPGVPADSTPDASAGQQGGTAPDPAPGQQVDTAADAAPEQGADPAAGNVAGQRVDTAAEAATRQAPAAEAVAGGDTAPPGADAPPAAVAATPATGVSMDEAALRGALESILLVVDEPVGDGALADALGEPRERVAFTLAALSAEYTAAGRGIDVRRVAGGWRLYTRAEYADYVERFVLDGQQARLSQAALETLAVVAYKQPVTRSRISAIRGVNCDGVTRTLVTRGLIAECGTEPETGAHLYRTTPLFLEKLGLESVEQLPPLAPFLPDDVEEIADA